MSIVWTPRDHQLLGSSFLFDHSRCNLWAHPGLGKTSMCYRLFDLMKLCGSAFFPILVIAPLAVARDVWPSEQAKWTDFAGIRVIPVIGSQAQRVNALMLKGDIYCINYENLNWLINYLGNRWPFRMVVSDESTRLRGFRLSGKYTAEPGELAKGVVGGTGRAGALAQVAHMCGRWINLTGTPSPHGLESLWGQQWFVDFGARLGETYGWFKQRFFNVDQYTREWTPRPGAREEIYELLADCTMALRAEDWLPVIKPNFFERRVTLPPDALKHYKHMERQMFIEMPKGNIAAWNGAVKSLKLVQIASGSIYDEHGVDHFMHDAKIDALRRLYDELQENLLVVYHFKFDAAKIIAEFPEARIYKNKKDEDLWNDGKLPMLLVHPKSAGHGLNLQYGGRAICFFTNTWDLELRQQVLERIGPARQLAAGFNRSVLIYDLIADRTIDENVLDRLEGRATEQDALMAARARALGD